MGLTHAHDMLPDVKLSGTSLGRWTIADTGTWGQGGWSSCDASFGVTAMTRATCLHPTIISDCGWLQAGMLCDGWWHVGVTHVRYAHPVVNTPER